MLNILNKLNLVLQTVFKRNALNLRMHRYTLHNEKCNQKQQNVSCNSSVRVTYKKVISIPRYYPTPLVHEARLKIPHRYLLRTK